MIVFLLLTLLHPVHETLAEVQWDAEANHVEVALRLDILDEQLLKKELAGGEKVSQWAIPYLQQRFRITEPTKPELPDNCVYCWVGRQEEGSHVWWYFEIKPDDKSRPQWIDQRVFLERQDNYTNRVLSLDYTPRRMLTLTSERPRANWDEATDPSATLNDSPKNESTTDR